MGLDRSPLVGIACAAILAVGCGLGAGTGSPGTAMLTVTRDYGAEVVREATRDEPPESETVLRLLDGEAEIETRFGGGFVQSIEGLAGGTEEGRRHDWFFYVNGIESPIGSAEVEVRGGDRVWWDHHDWTDAMRVPAVVGSWPEPFLQASAGEDRLPVRVECAARPRACRAAVDNLADEGVSVSRVPLGRERDTEALRMLVGAWSELRGDPAAAQLAAGPQRSGVFARFRRGGSELAALDERAKPGARLGRGAGIVAALRDGESPVTWIVSGVDQAGVRAAAAALADDQLANRFAVIVGAGTDDALAVPVPEAG